MFDTRQSRDIGEQSPTSTDTTAGVDVDRSELQREASGAAAEQVYGINLRTAELTPEESAEFSDVYTFEVPEGRTVTFNYQRDIEGGVASGEFHLSDSALHYHDGKNAYVEREIRDGKQYFRVKVYKGFEGELGVHTTGRDYNFETDSDKQESHINETSADGGPSYATEDYEEKVRKLNERLEEMRRYRDAEHAEELDRIQSRKEGAARNMHDSKEAYENQGFWTSMSGDGAALHQSYLADKTMYEQYELNEKELLAQIAATERSEAEAEEALIEAEKLIQEGRFEDAYQLLDRATVSTDSSRTNMQRGARLNFSSIASESLRDSSELAEVAVEYLDTAESRARTVRNGTVVIAATLLTGGAAGAVAGGGGVAAATTTVVQATVSATAIGATSSIVENTGHVLYGNKTAADAVSDTIDQAGEDMESALVASASTVLGGRAAQAAAGVIPAQAAVVGARAMTGAAAGAASTATSAVIDATVARQEAIAEFDEIYQYSDFTAEEREQILQTMLAERGLTWEQIAEQTGDSAVLGGVAGLIGGRAVTTSNNITAQAAVHAREYTAALAASALTSGMMEDGLTYDTAGEVLVDATLGYVAGNLNATSGTRVTRQEQDLTVASRRRSTIIDEEPLRLTSEVDETTTTRRAHRRNPNPEPDTDQRRNPQIEPEVVQATHEPETYNGFSSPYEVKNMFDAYQVLGLDPRLPHTESEWKAAYRQHAMKTHTDHSGSADHFKIVQRAFEILNA